MLNPITPNELAKQLRTSWRIVISWIESGELAAVNVARSNARRPRWLIGQDAINDFLRRRAAQPKPAPRKCRKKVECTDTFGF